MTDIPALARHRAHCAARLEVVGAEKCSRDPEERAAQNEGYRKALAAYVDAEAAYNRAVATLTAVELASVLGERAA